MNLKKTYNDNNMKKKCINIKSLLLEIVVSAKLH